MHCLTDEDAAQQAMLQAFVFSAMQQEGGGDQSHVVAVLPLSLSQGAPWLLPPSRGCNQPHATTGSVQPQLWASNNQPQVSLQAGGACIVSRSCLVAAVLTECCSSILCFGVFLQCGSCALAGWLAGCLLRQRVSLMYS
jgi:hypothetical protein